MTIGKHAETFAGRRIVDFETGKPLLDLKSHAYRLSVDYDDEESITEKFAAYLENPNSRGTEALVIGAWQKDDSQADSEQIVEAIVSASKKLPSLRALFLGDITYEQNEISAAILIASLRSFASTMKESAQLCQELHGRGQYVSASPLQSVASATSIRVRGGKPVITDGPFAETREQLGGYFMVEANDLNDAIKIAAKIPGARKGTVEIRPVMEIAGLPENSGGK